jgi:hypothetical protein
MTDTNREGPAILRVAFCDGCAHLDDDESICRATGRTLDFGGPIWSIDGNLSDRQTPAWCPFLKAQEARP